MNFIISDKDTSAIRADYEIRFVSGDNLESSGDKEILTMLGFEEGSVCDLPNQRRVYVSLKDTSPETLRIAISKVVKVLSGHNLKTVKMPKLSAPAAGQIGAEAALREIEAALSAIAEGFILSAYSFDKYKSKSKPCSIEAVYISVTGCDRVTAEGALKKGRVIAEATNYVRDIANEIPEVYTPQKMVKDAQELAANFNSIICHDYSRDYLKAQDMNAFLAVSQGGRHEPELIHLIYTPKGEAKKKVCFVGKGLTYDSGGLSLKPTASMYTMKADKAGAAAAMGIIKAAAELEVPYEVHAVLGVTENMIGQAAYKPDDVIRTREGVTVEVTNTDAEGRMVLCDCLSWAQDEVQPDYLIDLATLTGACVMGLGDYTSGVLGNNYDLQVGFKMKAQASGENYTVLEFNDHLRKIVESKIADVRNAMPGSMGGAITAGIFLDKFIRDEYKDRWLHLDIAGPAYVGDAWGYNPAGASGAGVRGCMYWLMEQ